MSAFPCVRLARCADARTIAGMSRDLIEQGLGWSWTPLRVLAAVRDAACNVAVIDAADSLAAFGIMQYGDDTAHLSLLAVHPDHRRRRIGATLVAWLEKPAEVAGIGRICLEARADNPGAIAFYLKLGYREAGRVARYYRGTLDAIRLEKRLLFPLDTLAS